MTGHTPPGTRTPAPLIKSQLPANRNALRRNDLDETSTEGAAPLQRAAQSDGLLAAIEAADGVPDELKRALVAVVESWEGRTDRP